LPASAPWAERKARWALARKPRPDAEEEHLAFPVHLQAPAFRAIERLPTGEDGDNLALSDRHGLRADRAAYHSIPAAAGVPPCEAGH
jgi:hypothetical protein